MGDAGGMSFNFFGPSEEVPSRGSATAAGETSWEAGASMEQSVAHEYFGEITSSNIPPLEDISFVKIVQAAVQFRREK